MPSAGRTAGSLARERRQWHEARQEHFTGFECDQATLQRAVTLAKDRGARLTIVYPVKDIPDAQTRVTVGRKAIDVRTLVFQEEKSRLKQVAKSAREAGIR
jgi:nucleotide-binding universal stress UspA family protein